MFAANRLLPAAEDQHVRPSSRRFSPRRCCCCDDRPYEPLRRTPTCAVAQWLPSWWPATHAGPLFMFPRLRAADRLLLLLPTPPWCSARRTRRRDLRSTCGFMPQSAPARSPPSTRFRADLRITVIGAADITIVLPCWPGNAGSLLPKKRPLPTWAAPRLLIVVIVTRDTVTQIQSQPFGAPVRSRIRKVEALRVNRGPVGTTRSFPPRGPSPEQ